MENLPESTEPKPEPAASGAPVPEPVIPELPVLPVTEEILEPNKYLAAAACVLLLMVTLGAFAATESLTPLIVSWVKRANPNAFAKAEVRTAMNFLAVLSVPAVLCISYLGWACLMAFRIFREGEFPPRGYPILVPTRVKRGAAARREGWLFVGFGLVAGLLVTYLVWVWIDTFPVVTVLRALF